MRWALVLCLGVWLALPLRAGAQGMDPGTMCSAGVFGHVQCIRPAHFVHDLCQAIEVFATRHGLAPGFFARLIWQESRFDPNALSHANAQGIAQFIPSTARLRGLKDPYNPAEALEYSAEYLGEMSRKYGNHGLAAVGYNGGERRAEGLIAGTGGLASETVNYVRIITGIEARDWVDEPPETHDYRLQKDKPFAAACHDLARNRKLSPFPERPQQRARYAYGVQMAFGPTKTAALKQYEQRSRRCRALVKGETPELIWKKSRASPKGGYYMARIGRAAQRPAWEFCRKLKAKGCLCAVYRNP